jgi:hypothetical protein
MISKTVDYEAAEVLCNFCGNSIDRESSEDHYTNCPQRMIPCQFCTEPVSLPDMEAHEKECGM